MVVCEFDVVMVVDLFCDSDENVKVVIVCVCVGVSEDEVWSVFFFVEGYVWVVLEEFGVKN